MRLRLAPAATAARVVTVARAVPAAAAAVDRASGSSRREDRSHRPAMCLCSARAAQVAQRRREVTRAATGCRRRCIRTVFRYDKTKAGERELSGFCTLDDGGFSRRIHPLFSLLNMTRRVVILSEARGTRA